MCVTTFIFVLLWNWPRESNLSPHGWTLSSLQQISSTLLLVLRGEMSRHKSFKHAWWKTSLRERPRHGNEYHVNGGEMRTEQSIQSSVWINTKWVPWFPVPSANQEPLRHLLPNWIFVGTAEKALKANLFLPIPRYVRASTLSVDVDSILGSGEEGTPPAQSKP